MAKLKWQGADFGRWRLEGRTVIHQSWAGLVWRRKASALPYTPDCQFGVPPSPPPPPSIVTWHVKVHARDFSEEDPETGMVFRLLQICFGVTKTHKGTGEVFHHAEFREYPGYLVSDLTLTVLFVSFSADGLSKSWRIHLPDLEETFVLSVPPFNGLVPFEPNIDEQLHEV